MLQCSIFSWIHSTYTYISLYRCLFPDFWLHFSRKCQKLQRFHGLACVTRVCMSLYWPNDFRELR
jgi:hypothetical protein